MSIHSILDAIVLSKFASSVKAVSSHLPMAEFVKCFLMDISQFICSDIMQIPEQPLFSQGLTMTKPNFSQMTRQELRAYVLAHREDDDAIKELIKRSNPNSPTYPFPKRMKALTKWKKF